MLRKLLIRNYAIIQDLEMDLEEGLVIMTGETGSGKSILLGALSLIMGDRADTKVVFDPAQKCFVEAWFDIENYDLKAFFKEEDLDYEPSLCIRREITPQGKSRAFINDTPVNLTTLQVLCAQLIDLHQQFDTHQLNQKNFQMQVLDAVSQSQTVLDQYRDSFKQYQKALHHLETLKNQQAQAIRERAFIQFQFDELEEARLKKGEKSGLTEELRILSHAEDIQKVAAAGTQMISESERSIVDQLGSIQHQINSLSHAYPEFPSLSERLSAVTIELDDIASELSKISESVEYNPELAKELQERIDMLNRLELKHMVQDADELIEIKEKMETQLSIFEDIENAIINAEKDLSQKESALNKLASELTQKRKAVISPIEKKIQESLSLLNMAQAELKIQFTASSKYHASGRDEVEFLFSTNKGGKLLPIKDIASGGELSRLALSLKSLIAKSVSLPTMIFDEIDTGISGQVALQMGKMLKELAKGHQVIVITHTPQVASQAKQHFVVYKQIDKDRSYTKIKRLDTQDKVQAIAVMLSTDPPTAAAMENAKELIDLPS
jgi:DNA repair protein RecN (Recombination protein N)